MKNKGPSEGREIRIDFPTDHDWKGLFEEIEKVPDPPVKVCTLVEGLCSKLLLYLLEHKTVVFSKTNSISC